MRGKGTTPVPGRWDTPQTPTEVAGECGFPNYSACQQFAPGLSLAKI